MLFRHWGQCRCGAGALIPESELMDGFVGAEFAIGFLEPYHTDIPNQTTHNPHPSGDETDSSALTEKLLLFFRCQNSMKQVRASGSTPTRCLCLCIRSTNMIEHEDILLWDVFRNSGEGSQARSTAPDSGSGLIGVLGFESLPSHFLLIRYCTVSGVLQTIFSIF